MNTHPHVLNSSRPSRVARRVSVIKWSKDLVLQAARERTRSITVTDSKGLTAIDYEDIPHADGTTTDAEDWVSEVRIRPGTKSGVQPKVTAEQVATEKARKTST